MNILRYLGYGWLVLIAAIVANMVVMLFKGVTWYDYIGSISKLGIKAATLSLNPGEIFFLFIIYPGMFGLIIYWAVLRQR